VRRILWAATCAIVLSSAVTAGNQVAALDGTTWALTVEPDATAKAGGESRFKETLKFVDGKMSLSAPKVGVQEAPYSVSTVGEKEWTFQTKRASAAEGSSSWTGTVHGKTIEGKLVLTKSGGVVLMYSFKGYKLN
jgi:hypothetical protein